MARVSVRTRVTARSIAGTVAEFDSLAARLAADTGTERPPHWALKHRDLDDVEVWGPLAEAADIDMERVRGLVLWVGTQHIDSRRITLTADWIGVRADVWGESPEWSRDTAAVVIGRIRSMRPWWAFWRTGWGSYLLSLMTGLIAVGAYAVVASILGVGVSLLTLSIVAFVTILVASFTLTRAVPAIRIGTRRRVGAVVGAVVAWVASALGTGLIGALIALAISPPS